MLRAWQATHPEYETIRRKRRYADPAERARMLAAHKLHAHRKRANGGRGVTVDQLLELLSKPCHYCGGEACELDHVVPVSRGGLHDVDNVVPACRGCNASKGARTPEEWQVRRAS
jgi:5-methylcytosine-specific restriction endonuclease McrA